MTARVAYIDYTEAAAQQAAIKAELQLQAQRIQVLEKLPRDKRPPPRPYEGPRRPRDDRAPRCASR